MDGLSLYKVATVLNHHYSGAKLNKISVADDRMVLQLYAGEKVNVTIRVGSADPMVYVGEDEIQVKADPLKVMNGSVVRSIETRSFDRLMTIVFDKRRPSGKIVTYRVIAEMVGRNSNVFVLNDDGRIIFAVNANNVDKDREIHVGDTYQPFKLNKQWDLNNVGTAKGFNDLIGFYPVTASHAEAVLESVADFSEAAVKLKALIDSDEKFYMDEKFKMVPFKISPSVEGVSVDQLGTVFRPQKKEKNADRKGKLESHFFKKNKKYSQLIVKLKKDLSNAEDYERLYIEAGLLKDNLHIICKGSGIVVIHRYSNAGIEDLEFHIDGAVNYEKKVRDMFKKANRLQRSISQIEQRISEIESCVAAVKDDLFFIEEASIVEINEMYTDIFMAKHKVKKEKFKHRFVTYQFGEAVYYVGKNSVVNHELVFGFARPDDLWFHAQKIPSGHLILRKNGDPTVEEIEIAAQIVSHYSKHANENVVAVDYVQKKYVKKPKNTPMGFVIYSNFKTVSVCPFREVELDALIKE